MKRAEVFIAFGLVEMAPGTNCVSEMALRPFSIMLARLLLVIVSPVAVDSVCRIGATSVTSTVTPVSPTCRLTSSRAIWLTSSLNGPTTDLLKPLFSTETV